MDGDGYNLVGFETRGQKDKGCYPLLDSDLGPKTTWRGDPTRFSRRANLVGLRSPAPVA